ncbi:MAG: single-stranded-DNA-specific exonuclease RecJ [Clostridia bacterium]|nr:single-stranded-DNA-specific exonuclease RecJ [Clostridia bacterium]
MHTVHLRETPHVPQELTAYPGWMARLLAARGLESREAAEAFLHPSREQILPPLLLHDMEKARDILLDGVLQKVPMVVYGDYDCDGVCASAILLETLEKMGADVHPYIPDRHKEGYGLNMEAVGRLSEKYRLMVTVDCGITSVQEVALAREKGMQVIVTDHHTVGDTLPPADAIVTPLLGDYPFRGLCGAGVAWKLALALAGQEAEELMELAALATVADLVPLLQENRALVKLGLEKMGNTKRPGLVTLMQVAGVKGAVDSQQVAFQLAPRINACGRMDTALLALELLRTRDAARAMELAQKAQQLNEERKQMENAVILDAQAQAAEMDLQKYHALVVQGDTWNSGVVGLAAGKMAEMYGYPIVALAREGENLVGSARSASDVDIYRALKSCEDLFLRFGGHKQAAGMTLKAENLPAFRERLNDAVKAQLQGLAPRKQVVCDGEMALADVTVEGIERLSLMEPFGMGNPSPLFLCRHALALNLRAVGAEGKHLQCTFQQGEHLRKGIFFGGGRWQGQEGTFSLAFSPSLNEFRGDVTAQLQLKHMALEPLALKKDEAREMLHFACAQRMESQRALISEETLPGLMEGEQGTLLVCRTLETALAMHRRFPKAVFALEDAADPRAYHTILLYGGPGKACAPFRHVVLCDGGLMEDAAWQKACPEAKVYAMPESESVHQLARQAALYKDALRSCYVAVKKALPRDLISFSEQAGITLSQAHFALRVLGEIGLIDYTAQPFSVQLLPMAKHDPSESVFYRLVHRLKEETDGVFGL